MTREVTVLRICPGSGRKYGDWSLGISGDTETTDQCPVCGKPVRVVGRKDETLRGKSGVWTVAEHPEIVRGVPV